MTLPPAVGPSVATIGRAEPDLMGFLWLVGFVLAGFLVLARLSQGVVDGDGDNADRPSRRPDSEGRRRRRSEPRQARSPVEPSGEDDGNAVDAGASGGENAADADATDDEDSPGARPLAPDGATGRVGASRGDRPADPEGSVVDRGPAPVDPVTAPADEPTMSPGMLLLNVALTQGLFGALVAGGAWYFGVPPATLGASGNALSTGLPALAVGVGFGLALWVGNELASGLAAATGADYDEGLRTMLAPTGTRGWALLLGATLPVIAVVEELIFRAAVVGAGSAALSASPWLLAVVSSVAFALGHGAQGRVGVVVTGGLGFALAAGFVVTNSFLMVVVAHYLVNALEFLVHEGLGLPDPVWD